jgi:hypothetical protein
MESSCERGNETSGSIKGRVYTKSTASRVVLISIKFS